MQYMSEEAKKKHNKIAILHLSDLHFGPYLQAVSEAGEWAAFAKPHSFLLLQGMEARVLNILKAYEGRLISAVTGDITTAAEPPAYEVVYQYLRDKSFIAGQRKVGLDLKNHLYAVPGNHDVWLYGTWFSKWKDHRNRREIYTKYFEDPIPQAYPIMLNGIAITLFTVDSNRLRSLGILNANFKNATGKGEVGDGQLAEIQNIHNTLMQNKFEGTPEGFDYEKSIKVALMHHHLAIPSEVPRDHGQRMLELMDADTVINAFCGIGIHIVLCGHQHFAYHLPSLKRSDTIDHSLFMSCAGSATQIGCSNNSFCVYEISEDVNEWNIILKRYETEDGGFTFQEKEVIPHSIKR